MRDAVAPGTGPRALRDLGVQVSEAAAALSEEDSSMSIERITDFDADVVVVGVDGDVALSPQLQDVLDLMSATRTGRLLTVNAQAWGFSVPSGLDLVLDDLEAAADTLRF